MTKITVEFGGQPIQVNLAGARGPAGADGLMAAASSAEIDAGTDDTKAATPLALAGSYLAKAPQALSTQFFMRGRAYFDPATRTISFPQVVARARNSTDDLIYTPATTFDVVFESAGNQLLYLDMSVPEGATNPFVVGVAGAAIPLDATKVPIGFYGGARFTSFFDIDLQYANRPGAEIQHVAANLPIIYVNNASHGVPADTWMVPKNLSYRNGGVATITIANAASVAIDPTAAHTWAANYCEVAGGAVPQNSLFLDLGDNTVKSIPATTVISGSKSGYIPLAMYHTGDTIQALSGVEARIVDQDPRDMPQLAWLDRGTWDPDTRTISLPQSIARRPSASSLFNVNTPPDTWYDVVFNSTGAQVLLYDSKVASGTSPYIVRAYNAARPFDETEVPIALYWLGELISLALPDIQWTNKVDDRVTHISSNFKVIFVPEGGNEYGITTGTHGSWMVPINTRYRYNGTSLATVLNTPSAAVDPTGTYTWSDYAQIDVNHAAETTLYLDPGARMVAEAPNTTELKGTRSGFVALAVRHYAGVKPLQARSGLAVIYAGEDPELLFGRMDAVEIAVDALDSGEGLLSNGETLRRYQKKLAMIRSGGTAVVRVASAPADSWWDRPASGAELLARFAADGIAMSSSGYIPLNPELSAATVGKSNGVKLSQADGITPLHEGAAPWTFEDASDAGAPVTAFLSASGNVLSTTGTDRTFLASDIAGETIDLVYHDTDGSFDYQINGTGGAWTTVAGTNTGEAIRIQIATGLVGTANTVNIRTTGNIGTVRLLDLYADGAAAGFQFNQMANGESTAAHWQNWIAAFVREITAMDVDLLICGLGVNDQRTAIDPATFGPDIQNIIDAVRTAMPDIGILFVCPPRCVGEGDPANFSMQAFGAQYQALYAANDGTEIVRLDKLWGPYDQENSAPSTFAPDGSHLNAGNGAHRRYVGSFYDHMLRRYL